MRWFDYAAPTSVDSAVALLAQTADAYPLAGGTDLIGELRTGRVHASVLVDIKRIPELMEIRYDESGLSLGAAVPCYRIYRDQSIARAYPALAEVAQSIGGTQIQGRASIGGNLCNASPSADCAPLLIALRATCRIAGPHGIRTVPVETFFTGPRRNALWPGELLLSVHVQRSPIHSGACYRRATPRAEMDIAVAGAAAAVVLDGDRIAAARLALAAVAPTPILVPGTNETLLGERVSAGLISTAAELSRRAAVPITDMRGSARYRRHLCGVLASRALQEAIQQARRPQ
jgi:CO/xanthine dehydrogenase FAD-binding subunit